MTTSMSTGSFWRGLSFGVLFMGLHIGFLAPLASGSLQTQEGEEN